MVSEIGFSDGTQLGWYKGFLNHVNYGTESTVKPGEAACAIDLQVQHFIGYTFSFHGRIFYDEFFGFCRYYTGRGEFFRIASFVDHMLRDALGFLGILVFCSAALRTKIYRHSSDTQSYKLNGYTPFNWLAVLMLCCTNATRT